MVIIENDLLNPLADNSNHLPKTFDIQSLNIYAVDQNLTLIGIVKTFNQLKTRRFTTT